MGTVFLAEQDHSRRRVALKMIRPGLFSPGLLKRFRFEADVLGPAGLELSYTINDRWYLGGGGVYRSFRFRLDDEGVAPNGIGENEGIVSFLRLHRTGDKGLDLNIYIGATVDGRLELKDSEGHKLASGDYDTAPFVAVTFHGDF